MAEAVVPPRKQIASKELGKGKMFPTRDIVSSVLLVDCCCTADSKAHMRRSQRTDSEVIKLIHFAGGLRCIKNTLDTKVTEAYPVYSHLVRSMFGQVYGQN